MTEQTPTTAALIREENDTSPTTDERVAALAAHTGDPADEYDTDTYYDGTHTAYQYGREEWVVLTDEEADAVAAAEIERSLWAFKSEWLTTWTGLPEAAIRAIQDAMYEDASETFATLIRQHDDEGTLDAFVSASVSADGRGHFLSQYDGQEVELDGGALYAYRVQ